jgi:hypothetical protein
VLIAVPFGLAVLDHFFLCSPLSNLAIWLGHGWDSAVFAFAPLPGSAAVPLFFSLADRSFTSPSLTLDVNFEGNKSLSSVPLSLYAS